MEKTRSCDGCWKCKAKKINFSTKTRSDLFQIWSFERWLIMLKREVHFCFNVHFHVVFFWCWLGESEECSVLQQHGVDVVCFCNWVSLSSVSSSWISLAYLAAREIQNMNNVAIEKRGERRGEESEKGEGNWLIVASLIGSVAAVAVSSKSLIQRCWIVDSTRLSELWGLVGGVLFCLSDVGLCRKWKSSSSLCLVTHILFSSPHGLLLLTYLSWRNGTERKQHTF